MEQGLSQYLYQLRPTRMAMLREGPTPAESDVLGAHVAYLEALSAQATVLLAGRTQTEDDTTFGLVILQAASAAEARQVMLADPAVANGVMTAELYPYRIATVSPSILSVG